MPTHGNREVRKVLEPGRDVETSAMTDGSRPGGRNDVGLSQAADSALIMM